MTPLRHPAPEGTLAPLEVHVYVRHGVAADHHGDIRLQAIDPGMCDHAMPERRDDAREIFVLPHARVSVIAGDPEACRVPLAASFEIVTHGGHRVVDDEECLEHALARMAVGLGRFGYGRP